MFSTCTNPLLLCMEVMWRGQRSRRRVNLFEARRARSRRVVYARISAIAAPPYFCRLISTGWSAAPSPTRKPFSPDLAAGGNAAFD